MRRAGLLFCADIDLGRFTTYRARAMLPFFASTEDNVGKYQSFSLKDAFELRVMLDLTEENGLPPGEASAIVQNVDWFPWHPLDEGYYAGHGDMILARASYYMRDETANQMLGNFTLGGPESNILARLHDKHAKAWGEHPGQADPFFRIVMVNATRAAKFVRMRAKELGLPEGDDTAPIWPEAKSSQPVWASKQDETE